MMALDANKHRWKKSVGDRVAAVLEDAVAGLKWAWVQDQQFPRSYPLNTWYQFLEIEQELEDKPARQQRVRLLRPAPPPATFSELLDERVIAAIYEEQNQGTYKNALRKAAKDFEDGPKLWRKLMRAADAAYLVHLYGLQAMPKPKTQFLHRKLLHLVDLLDLGLTPEGLAEFFDDTCPCGRRHKPDSIDRLARRRQRTSGERS